MNTSGWLVALALLLVGCAGVALWVRAEGTPPGVAAPESILVGRSGETLKLVDKSGRPRGTIKILRQEEIPFSEIDAGLASSMSMTLDQISQVARHANSRDLQPSEPMRITYLKVVSKK